MLKNFLSALLVTLVLWTVLLFLELSNGVSPTTISTVIPIACGFVVYYCLKAMSSNRKEIRVNDGSRQTLLNAVAPAGEALLYIYREGFAGKAVGWNVSLDGSALAQLRSPRFTQTALRPGRHTLGVALSSSGFAGTKYTPAETGFEAQPGDVIVFAMKQKMGALGNTLSVVREQDTDAALKRLSKMPMVATEVAGGSNAS
jgi:hypothetical protein